MDRIALPINDAFSTNARLPTQYTSAAAFDSADATRDGQRDREKAAVHRTRHREEATDSGSLGVFLRATLARISTSALEGGGLSSS